MLIVIISRIRISVRPFSRPDNSCVTFPVWLTAVIISSVNPPAVRKIIATITLWLPYRIIVSSERGIVGPVTVIRPVTPVITSYIITVTPEAVIIISVSNTSIVPVIPFKLTGTNASVIITTDIRAIKAYFIIPELCSARSV